MIGLNHFQGLLPLNPALTHQALFPGAEYWTALSLSTLTVFSIGPEENGLLNSGRHATIQNPQLAINIDLSTGGSINQPYKIVARIYKGRANNGVTNVRLRRTNVTASLTIPAQPPGSFDLLNYKSKNGSGTTTVCPGEYVFVLLEVFGTEESTAEVTATFTFG